MQTSTQRDAQHRARHAGDYPPVNVHTLMGTLRAYQEDASGAFIQSVYDLWRRLDKARYVRNAHVCFERTQILERACEELRSADTLFMRSHGSGPLTDLVQILGMYATQGVRFALAGVPDSWTTMARYTPGVWHEYGAFKLKLFKNGTMHLVMSEALREAMNKTLATAAGRRLHEER